ncbi:MAG TPA: hypothetical protein VFS59_07955 [Gemmatimonadaceae bacterium]|nr:hypothetical protein [Gemmatimonadaceae bacterium]
MRTTRSLVSRAALAAAMIAGLAAVTAATTSTVDAAMFGGPWISIEAPANPYDQATRGSLFLVHTFHHGAKVDLPVSARAEGLVDGERKSVALTLSKGSQAGTQGVRNQWGAKGTWTVLATANESGNNIQAVVEINADGSVGKISVPSRDGRPHLLSVAEIDRGLRERAGVRATANR